MHPPMEGIKARDRIGRIRPRPGVTLLNGKILEGYINMLGVTAQTEAVSVCLLLHILDPLRHGTRLVLHPGPW